MKQAKKGAKVRRSRVIAFLGHEKMEAVIEKAKQREGKKLMIGRRCVEKREIEKPEEFSAENGKKKVNQVR